MPRTSRTSQTAYRPAVAIPTIVIAHAGLALVTFAAFVLAFPAVASADHGSAHHGQAGAAMSEAEMRAQADAYWAAHARVGSSPRPAQAAHTAAAATFTVSDFRFDLGVAGAVDTAKITAGQSVDWVWSSGIHTITNGEDSLDPNMGTLFNQPSDTSNPIFSFVFPNPGTYPFFCTFHEFFNMRGIVVVSATTGVGGPNGAQPLGFTRDPAPNPSPSGIRFEYALGAPGHVLAEVFDPAGRRVAVIVDEDRPGGSFSAAWDGRTTGGTAITGVYYVRLRLPGFDQSRRVVLRR